MKEDLNEQFTEDLQRILDSHDEVELFELILQSQLESDRLNFLYFILEELTSDNLNHHIDGFEEAYKPFSWDNNDLQENRDRKYNSLIQIRNLIPSKIIESKETITNNHNLIIPYPKEVKNQIINKIHSSLNSYCFDVELEEFRKHFYNMPFTKIAWLIPVGNLKGFFDKATTEGIFSFSNINKELSFHFCRENGDPYKAKDISSTKDKCYISIDTKVQNSNNPFVLLIWELKKIIDSSRK